MSIRTITTALKQVFLREKPRSRSVDPPRYHIATLELTNLIAVKDLWDKKPFRLRLNSKNPSGSPQEVAYCFRDIGLGVGDIWVEPGENPQAYEVYSTGDLDLDLFQQEASRIKWLDSVWMKIWPKCLEAAQDCQRDYEKPITEEIVPDDVSISPPGDYVDYETKEWEIGFRTRGDFSVSFDENLEIVDVGVAF